MRILITTFLLAFTFLMATAQEKMTNDGLGEIIQSMADSVSGGHGQWSFHINDMPLICLTDEKHDRMRIITPITDVQSLENGAMEKCMAANFHTALDVKYCTADGILWAAYIHPLSVLNKDQVEDAIKQVFVASATYGTIYTSTDLVFPGGEKPAPKKKKEDRS